MSLQMRVVLATVLSMIVFLGFDYFFMPERMEPQPVTQERQVGQVADTNAAIQTPVVAQESAQTPEKVSAAKAPVADAEMSKILCTVRTGHMRYTIDDLGRIAQAYLLDTQYHDDAGEALKFYNEAVSPKPLEIRFSDAKLNEEAFKTPYVASSTDLSIGDTPQTVTLTQTLASGFTVEKRLTFFPDGHYDLAVNLSEEKRYYISPGYRPDLKVDPMTVHGVLVKQADGTLEIIDDGDAKGNEAFRNSRIMAAFDRYYATAFYNFEEGLNVVISKDGEENPILFAEGGSAELFHGYIGPKEYRRIKAISVELSDIVEFGWFTFIAAPLFKFLLFLQHYIGNWGWTIVVLTFLIRVVLYPLTYKGMVSMARLKEIAPKIKEIQKKYKGDPQKMNVHMMELYKKHKANPLGGCLPMIMQIPIFFAIYRVLLNAIELKGADWILWINDLSVMDPYYILPILMGASMWLHQVVTPSNFTDPMQEKIFKWLPVIFTFFFVTFPAGLVLYWLTNNIFSVLQQLMINRILEKKKALKAEA